VRQFVIGVILVPTLITFLWFSVLGGTALYMQLSGQADLIGADKTVDVEGALFAMLGNLPGGAVLTIGAILLIAVFFITSADSGSLVMSMIASGGQVEPRRWVRVFFACVTSLLAIALLLSGGLEALKTAAIIIALPFSVVMLLICWSTIIAFSRERRAYDKARRAAFVEHIGDFYGLEVDEPDEREPESGWRSLFRRRGSRSAAPMETPTETLVASTSEAAPGEEITEEQLPKASTTPE
jgi:choline/glycine/proline betaine transport protein